MMVHLDFVQNPLVRTVQHLAGSGAWGMLAGGHTIGVGPQAILEVCLNCYELFSN